MIVRSRRSSPPASARRTSSRSSSTNVSSITASVPARCNAPHRAAAGGGVHDQPGRVVEVGHQVGERRPIGAGYRLERARCPSRRGRSAPGSAARRPPAARRARPDSSGAPPARAGRAAAIARIVRSSACSAPLVTRICSGRVGRPRRVEPRRDRAAQRRQAERVVAVVVEPAGKLAGAAAANSSSSTAGAGSAAIRMSRPAPLDDRVFRSRAMPAGQRHPASGALPALDVALLAQPVVGAGDRGAADPQRAASVRSAGSRLSTATRPSRISDRSAAASRSRPAPRRCHGPSSSTRRWGEVIAHGPLLANWPVRA